MKYLFLSLLSFLFFLNTTICFSQENDWLIGRWQGASDYSYFIEQLDAQEKVFFSIEKHSVETGTIVNKGAFKVGDNYILEIVWEGDPEMGTFRINEDDYIIELVEASQETALYRLDDDSSEYEDEYVEELATDENLFEETGRSEIVLADEDNEADTEERAITNESEDGKGRVLRLVLICLFAFLALVLAMLKMFSYLKKRGVSSESIKSRIESEEVQQKLAQLKDETIKKSKGIKSSIETNVVSKAKMISAPMFCFVAVIILHIIAFVCLSNGSKSADGLTTSTTLVLVGNLIAIGLTLIKGKGLFKYGLRKYGAILYLLGFPMTIVLLANANNPGINLLMAFVVLIASLAYWGRAESNSYAKFTNIVYTLADLFGGTSTSSSMDYSSRKSDSYSSSSSSNSTSKPKSRKVTYGYDGMDGSYRKDFSMIWEGDVSEETSLSKLKTHLRNAGGMTSQEIDSVHIIDDEPID